MLQCILRDANVKSMFFTLNTGCPKSHFPVMINAKNTLLRKRISPPERYKTPNPTKSSFCFSLSRSITFDVSSWKLDRCCKLAPKRSFPFILSSVVYTVTGLLVTVPFLITLAVVLLDRGVVGFLPVEIVRKGAGVLEASVFCVGRWPLPWHQKNITRGGEPMRPSNVNLKNVHYARHFAIYIYKKGGLTVLHLFYTLKFE
ncbi:hypothetical protein NQ317_010383 [Molorchus minor]|uniref:Transmembrane protein n=1 Tax=Molorchus minor TaxID=1323400 RepID=A0ABQ9IZ00_9CUCU|nr:hypothetical protein NQ317_010383 [Molorchus minor]